MEPTTNYTTRLLTPRYFIDNSLPLLKRDGSCGKDHHHCLDTGHGDQCCDNKSYCYVNSSGEPRCCPLGSNCVDDSKCNSKAYYCIRTLSPSTAANPPSSTNTIPNASIQTGAGCCGRRCPMPGYYLCPADLGGNCCPYSAECHAGGNCVAVNTPTSSVQPLITPAVEGCTTSQYKCADGTGCCNDWQTCTSVDDVAYCAQGTATGTNMPEVGGGSATSNGLSDGAKAGIGVTVVAGVGLAAGVGAWVWILLRRKRSRAAQDAGGFAGEVREVGGNDAEKEREREAVDNARQPQEADYVGRVTVLGNETDRSPGHDRAVPCHPETPGDITTPVEIDSAVLPTVQTEFGLPSVAELPECGSLPYHPSPTDL